jgi:hypothetical protein
LKEVFDTLRELMTPPTDPVPPKNPIGFVWSGDKAAGEAKPKAIKSKAGKG